MIYACLRPQTDGGAATQRRHNTFSHHRWDRRQTPNARTEYLATAAIKQSFAFFPSRRVRCSEHNWFSFVLRFCSQREFITIAGVRVY